MRRRVWLLFIVACLLCGCKSEKDVTETSPEESTMPSTAYPTGEMQRTFLFYNGILYVYSDRCKVKPESKLETYYPGYEYVGTVQKISNKELPDEEFEASRIEEGAKIYSNGTDVVIYSGRFMEMKIAEDEIKTSPEESTMPSTGYPTGEMQRTFLFYNGTLYVYSDRCKVKPESKLETYYPGYEYVGTVQKISNKELPDEELEASRIEEGAKIYSNGTNVVIYSGRFMEMKIAEDEILSKS